MVVNRRRTIRGITLLELLLSLSLSVLVLMAIGMAIQLHYRMLDVRRTNVEEARVVRQTFRMIADDLRSAVQYTPPDLTGLETVTGNTAAMASSVMNGLGGDAGGALGGLGSDSGGGDAGGNTQPGGGQSAQGGQGGSGQTGSTGSGRTGGAGGGTSSSSAGGTGGEEDPAAADASTSIVGLYGTLNELRFDISRLPRVDQYQSLMTESELSATDIPSDIKTVVYFVQDEASAASGGGPSPSMTGRGRGLMRAELDRAVSAWQEMNGDFESAYSGAKLLADEVVGLEFQYFDGTTWTEDWDSSEMGGLPVAVEVFLTLQPTAAMSEDEIAQIGNTDELPPEERTYRLVIRLPTAVSAATRELEAQAEETAAAEMQASEASGTQTAGSGTGSGSGGGTGGGNTGGGNSGGGITGGGNVGGPSGGGFGPGGGGPGGDGAGRDGRGGGAGRDGRGSGGDAGGGRGGRGEGGDAGGGRGGRGGGDEGGGSRGRGRTGGGSGGPRAGGGRGR